MLRRIGPCTRAGLLLSILAACAMAAAPRAAAGGLALTLDPSPASGRGEFHARHDFARISPPRQAEAGSGPSPLAPLPHAGEGWPKAGVRVGEGQPPAQQTGRPLGRADWLDRLPLALACIAVVVVVDAVVVVRILRKRRQGMNRPGSRGPNV